MIVVAVTGGRDYANKRYVFEVLNNIHTKTKIDLIVHGAATGADTYADYWADKKGVLQCKFPVTRGAWDRLGKAAGMIRNRIMLESVRPDILIAFPGGKGTSGCIREASRLGIRIIDLRKKDNEASNAFGI